MGKNRGRKKKKSGGGSSQVNSGVSEVPTSSSPDVTEVPPSSSSAVILTQEQIIRWRPLKLVYGHDIRVCKMPMYCGFKVLREIVRNCFPFSKSVLMKFNDTDGDLVTITSTAQLRLVESAADSLVTKEHESDKSYSVGMLRLHIIDVSLEQEPLLPDEEEVEELEKDDWLSDFAHLYLSHAGIDSFAHVHLHKLAMELCSKALEKTVTSEEAIALFDKPAANFEEIIALAYLEWGNVHMCVARKRIQLDESAKKETVVEKYNLAAKKYEQALAIKPDFYEGFLALGQQQLEMAKLNWSFAPKVNVSKWNSTKTLKLFDSAEEKIKSAKEMWEKLEKQRVNEASEAITEDSAQAIAMKSQIHRLWGNIQAVRSHVELKISKTGWEKNRDLAVEKFRLAGASETGISTLKDWIES